MSAEDVKVIQAMIRFGGSFVKALGHAAFAADPENLQKIKDTWPEYWEKYTDMAK
ncbi:MAG TPA: hypothetical protein PK911_05145 [Candidatus Saccharibacteria bacterium]|nr:hypothetical protein [Candidatus Saccharibacteria bacterium]